MRTDQQHVNKADAAFDRAIASGWLSANVNDAHYAGNYMYMGSEPGFNTVVDLFKHINTREYLPSVT